jgi:hypothetical protein
LDVYLSYFDFRIRFEASYGLTWSVWLWTMEIGVLRSTPCASVVFRCGKVGVDSRWYVEFVFFEKDGFVFESRVEYKAGTVTVKMSLCCSRSSFSSAVHNTNGMSQVTDI